MVAQKQTSGGGPGWDFFVAMRLGEDLGLP